MNKLGRPVNPGSYRQQALREGVSKSTIGYRLGKETKFRGLCAGCGIDVCGKQNKPQYFCSIRCHADFKYRLYIDAWKIGKNTGGRGKQGAVSNHVRRYLFEKYDSKCSRCGWNEVHPLTERIPLEVNHKDGDSSNHQEANLELLCPSCHSLTTTFRSLNKGKGRQR